MDLNVYEDDDDDTLHRKLIAAKIARKRAEEDMKLLSNRISLLKQEENKVIFKLIVRLGRKSMKLKRGPRTLSLRDNETSKISKRSSNDKNKRKMKR
jgi:hypothetical protein